MKNTSILGLTISELSEICKKYKTNSFVAEQIASWLYKKKVYDFDAMSNLSKNFREQLKSDFPIILKPYSNLQISQDGTKKYLFEYSEDRIVETAVIPENDRITVCVSSQAGCRFGCAFCATGKIGYKGNLSAGEILNQLAAIDEFDKITNIVFMGMGEPLDNWEEVYKAIEILTESWGYEMSPTRITVSTIGLIEKIKELIEKTKVNIAISLHSPFADERKFIMPVQNASPVVAVLKVIREANFPRHRKFSLEYILIKDLNMSKSHAAKLAEIAMFNKARINLIPFNANSELNFKTPSYSEVVKFQNEISKKGANVTLRKSRGLDIKAACGTLSANK